MITLDEAIESAKLAAGKERVIRQQHYNELVRQLPEEERFAFTMALADLNIGPRTGSREASEAVAEFLRNGSVREVIRKGTGLSDDVIADRLVRASMRRDAQWWQNLKDRFQNWWDQGPQDEYEEEFGEPFPYLDPGTEDLYSMEPKETVTPWFDDWRTPTTPDPNMPGPQPVIPPAPEEIPAPPEGLPGPPVEPVTVPVTEAPPAPPKEFGDKREIPQMVPVKSSNIEAVGYDAEEELMYVIFTAKKTTPRTMYRYSNVSQQEFDGLMNADSKGKYFAQVIRQSKPYTGPLSPEAYQL